MRLPRQGLLDTWIGARQKCDRLITEVLDEVKAHQPVLNDASGVVRACRTSALIRAPSVCWDMTA